LRIAPLVEDLERSQVIKPWGYLEFLDLMMHARMVLTDSGGIQEKITILGIPCLTNTRENTERTVVITAGTNVLVGTDPEHILAGAERILAGKSPVGRVPELWDGHAAKRIVHILREQIS